MIAPSAFRGVGVALVTPMTQDGSIDWDRFAEHVEFQIEGGVDYLVPCGTTGESATLLPQEKLDLIRKAVAVSGGRAPVMAGAGSNRTATAVEMAQAVVDAGADAVLSVSPCYNKPTQEGLYQHYRAIAEKLSVPLFVYNVPARTSSNVLPSTLLRLSELETIGGVKEASGNLSQAMELIRGRPEGFLVLSGDDSLTFAVVAHGGDGGIAVVANEAPESFSRMVHLGLDGAFTDARVLHDRLLPLMEANFLETNPIPVKAALEMMGRMEGHLRLPLTPLSEEKRQSLREALASSKVLP